MHNSQGFGAGFGGAGPQGGFGGRFPDPSSEMFSAGQTLYKSNLLNTINLFRAQAGHAPIGWPDKGATPCELLWQEGTARLVRYTRTDGSPSTGAPVLAVCSLVNRPYVIDLLPGRSIVQSLQKGGRDVWLLDWGTPDASSNQLGLEYYALGLIPRALDFVRSHTGKAPHLLGYCMGGTLSLLALASGAEARSLVSMATPVDMHDDGLLSLWTRSPGFDPRTIVDTYGHAPPHLLQPAFKMLDPVGLSTKLIHVRDKVGDSAFMTFFLAMEQWLEDSVAFPGRAFIEWIELYRANALLSKSFLVGQRALSLAKIERPVFTMYAENDYITPRRSSLAIETAAPNAPHTLHKVDGGHIGLATGSNAHKRAWPEVVRWLDEVDAATDAIEGLSSDRVRAKGEADNGKKRGAR